MTRLPSLGPRGEGWVVIQALLLSAVFLCGWLGPAWDDGARIMTSAAGVLFVIGGLLFAARGSRDLREALTPLPRPRAEAALVQTGVYARVRHPIYGGLIIAAVGWGLLTASIPALVMAGVLWTFFVVKSTREEVWLVERFPNYPQYRAQTRRFNPWIG